MLPTLLNVLLLAGCSSAPHQDTPVFDAWGPDGSGGEYEHPGARDLAVKASMEHGVIYRFEPGDVIHLQVELDGDIIRADTPMASTLRVQRPTWIHFGPGGPMVSFDGATWADLRDAATGSVSLDLAISEDDPRNQAILRLRAEQK